MVKTVHLQYSKASAGKAALRLHNAFLKSNIESSIISLHRDKNDNNKTRYLSKKSKLIARIDVELQSYKLRKINKEYGMFSYPILGTNIAQFDEIKMADFIYIHWALKGFLNFNAIDQLAKLNKPIIFIMHDMWAITGGCHHSFTCEKYTTKCHNCQFFPGTHERDLSTKEFEKKLKLYTKYNNFYFVSPSKWLYECSKKSLLTKDKPLFYIPNILDHTVFKPFEKKTAKQILNINPDETVIAFGAVSIDSPYKGWTYLQKALEILPKDENVFVLIFGSGYNKEIADKIPFKTRFIGYIEDEYSLTIIYNAANVFIAPSIAETFGYVIMEALCCGTPVVAFNTGGIPDLIRHQENGYLAKYRDAEDLAEGIKFCLQSNIKGYLLPNLEPALTVKKHLELFEYIKNESPN